MSPIGNIKEINDVKKHLEEMKQSGLILQWELPYENLLTRRSAAIFFFTPMSKDELSNISMQLNHYDGVSIKINTYKKLSKLDYIIEFCK